MQNIYLMMLTGPAVQNLDRAKQAELSLLHGFGDPCWEEAKLRVT